MAQFSDWQLREALCRLGYPQVDIILDARKFPDFKAQHLTRHTGIHPAIIERITLHDKFPSYLLDLRKKWRRAVYQHSVEQPGAPVRLVVALYCRTGKHRSVAVAECLRHIAEAAEDFHVYGVVHLSRSKWNKNVCKGGCEECMSSAQREVVLQRVECIWCQGG